MDSSSSAHSPTASGSKYRELTSLGNFVQRDHITQIVSSQRNMLSRFEKTNEMLVHCNNLAAMRFEVTSRELRRHTQTVIEMKRDLETIFKRIRRFKTMLAADYPEPFKELATTAEEDEDDDDVGPS